MVGTDAFLAALTAMSTSAEEPRDTFPINFPFATSQSFSDCAVSVHWKIIPGLSTLLVGGDELRIS